MLHAYWIVFLSVLILLKLLWVKNKKTPPGPFKWPIIGNIIEMHFANPKFAHLALAKLAKKYGDIMSVRVGVHDCIVLSAYEDMKEILTHENLSGRYPFQFSRDRSYKINQVPGLIWSSGKIWREMHQFSLRHLRDFGFGKSSSMEAIITVQLNDFITRIKKDISANNGIYHVVDNFSLSVVNILWQFIVGEGHSLNDDKLQQLLDANEQVLQTIKFNNVIVVRPDIRHLFPEISGFNRQLKAFTTQQNLFRELISNHKDNMDDGENNFIKRFLRNIKNDAENPLSNFTEERLIVLLMDFFLAGIETPTSMLTYALFLMLLNPGPQQKVQEEIQKIIPQGNHPSMADLEMMPYTQATILEIYRVANVLPVPPPRITSVDFPYKNFIIPKGNAIMFNTYCITMDEKYWGDPENFRPERFLNEDGKFIRDERVAVFGFGKRYCIGESLAKCMVSLYLLTLLQQFTFEPVPGNLPPSNIPRENFTMTPQPFDVLIKIRE